MQCRSEIDKGRYDELDSCNEAALLTSTFKLFLRELVEPIITKDIRDRLYDVMIHNEENNDIQTMVQKTKKVLELVETTTFEVLRYLLFHLKLISNIKGKKI